MEQGHHDGGRGGFFASRTNIALIGFLAIAGYFLVTEHWAHVVPFLPWSLLLACPLLHVFMHGGHGALTITRAIQRTTAGISPISIDPET